MTAVELVGNVLWLYLLIGFVLALAFGTLVAVGYKYNKEVRDTVDRSPVDIRIITGLLIVCWPHLIGTLINGKDKK